MKKRMALLLCCALLVCLLAACGADKSAPDASTETPVSELTPADIETDAPASDGEDHEEHDHVHINYKGLTTADYTLDDVVALEGREPDLTYDVDETTTLYIYNDITLNDLLFTQVQFSFADAYNRISCTCSGDEDTAVVMDRILQSMTTQFGEPAASETTYTWRDGHTSNYAMLTVLNETTVQLVFYLYEGKA